MMKRNIATNKTKTKNSRDNNFKYVNLREK